MTIPIQSSQASVAPTISSGQRSVVEERLDSLVTQVENQQQMFTEFKDIFQSFIQSQSPSTARDAEKARDASSFGTGL